MPRMFRLQAPGSIAHVMARGIEGRSIFCSDEDRTEFLRRFNKHIFDIGFKCLAWCLMDNHFHFLLRTNENVLSKLMRPLTEDTPDGLIENISVKAIYFRTDINPFYAKTRNTRNN